MKKLLIGMMAVGCMTAVAAAANPGAFDFAPGVVEPLAVLPGTSAVIVISATGSGDIAGAEINLRLDEPFKIESLELINGTVFQASNTGQTVAVYNDPLAPDSYADYVQSSITTASGTVPVAPGSVVAKLTVSVPAGTLLGIGGKLVSYDQDDSFTLRCNWGDGATVGQDQLLLITPEPATALLLLAAVPFLRRRSA